MSFESAELAAPGPVGEAVGMALALGLADWASRTAGTVQARQVEDLEPQSARPEAKRDDPKARALFDEVSKAYQALSSYSDQGQFVMAMTARRQGPETGLAAQADACASQQG